MDGLTAFDVVVGLLVGLAALAGLARGFVGEVVSLAAWVAGVLAVRFLYTPAKALAAGVTGTEAGGAILAFVVLFLGAFVVVRIAGGRLSDTTRASVVGPVDRVLGLGFGAAKGVLASALLFLLASMALETLDPEGPPPEWLARARTAPTLAMVSRGLVDFVGEHARVAPDSAATDPHAGLPGFDRGQDGPDDGYDRQQRSALDRLLDEQQKQSPGTTI